MLPETGHTMKGGNAVLGGQLLDAALTPRRWSMSEWLAGEPAWSGLLERSQADALFLSWDWLTLWWHCFAPALAAVPEILGFYRGAELVGVAPLYRRRVVRSRVLPATSVQLIGMSWRDPVPTVSEYLDIIALDAEADAVRSACAQLLLRERSWTEWVIGFSAASRQWSDAFARPQDGSRHYVRHLDRQVSYQADLSAGFGAYLRSLGQSTRRSLWSLRRRLALHGAVSFELLSPAEIDGGFEELNRLHCLRWQQAAFAGTGLDFNTRLARRLAPRGELALSRLRVGGRTVSMLYDIRKGTRQYNISMGFDPSFSRKLSLGLLHLGYAMEAAAGRQVRTYDFLAGSGLRSDYKPHLSQSRRSLSGVQVLRGYVLPPLYRWHDRVH